MKQQHLIDHLRKESFEVKECFNRYSFQTMVLCGVALAAVFGVIAEHEQIVLALVPFFYLTFTVCKIGVHKYTSSNRLLGFELHLARLEEQLRLHRGQYPLTMRLERIRKVRWEEAMRAWRIVQAMAYQKVHITARDARGSWFRKLITSEWLRPIRLHDLIGKFHVERASEAEVQEEKKKWWQRSIPRPKGYWERRMQGCWDHHPSLQGNVSYRWYNLGHLTVLDTASSPPSSTDLWHSTYHGGQYLDRMNRVLFYMQAMMVITMGFGVVKAFAGHMPDLRTTAGLFPKIHQAWTTLGVSDKIQLGIMGGAFLVMLLHTWLHYVRINRHRGIIENGFLSIHSCSIMWNAVIVAHLLAQQNSPWHRHYTENLVTHSRDMSDNLGWIHKWIEDRTSRIQP